jgi:tRNA (guanine-N7-)-methyltransferase
MNKSFNRRLGHFTEAQKKAYQELSEKYLIPYKEEYLNFKDVFNNSENVILEIGFGSGFATARIAEANPEKNYLGVEVHKPGIGRLLREIENQKISNIRIIEYDVIDVVQKMIPESSLSAIHIFFPDPWPKKRHRKRRLIQRPFTDFLGNCLKPNGYLYMVTDWEDYAFHAVEELNSTPLLKNTCENFAPPQEWRPKTRFEEKGLAKEHVIRELMFIRE